MVGEPMPAGGFNPARDAARAATARGGRESARLGGGRALPVLRTGGFYLAGVREGWLASGCVAPGVVVQ